MDNTTDGQKSYKAKREQAIRTYMNTEAWGFTQTKESEFILKDDFAEDLYRVVGASLVVDVHGHDARTRSREVSKLVEEKRW